MGGGGAQFIWPREWLEKYGLGNEWKEQVGTGPYFVTDWVTNSVLSLKRNDNYWEKNPIGPGKGDQLPYMEAIKYHIIPDTSTRLASMRTGKADMMSTFFSFAREDALSLLQTNPEMKYVKVLTDPLQIGFRIDKADLPFKDLQVRRALSMAIDRPGILAGYYAGDGELLDSPARKLYPSIYTPINELPETAQELFEYNPDQAKKLLADAGYPDGFKTKVICMSDDTSINMAEIIKEDWSKVGVELEIQPKEGGVFWSIWGPRNFEELMLTASCGGNGVMWVRYSFGYYRGPNAFNISRADDPIGSDPTIEAAFLAQEKVINVDFAECDRLMKNLIPYLIDKVFLIQMPAPYGYRLWQPWIKNYYGEGVDKISIQYMWIDRDLKEKMTGRR
jgi:peptide/nickel transport system substrate-binding protein